MAQRVVQYILSMSGDQTVMDNFTAAIDTDLGNAGYDVSGSPTTYLKYFPLSTTYEDMLTDFTTIFTADYPSGQGLDIWVYDYDYIVNYNY